MASNGVLDLDRGDTETGLPPPDSPVRDTERPDPNDSDDSEVIINRNASRRRRSRSREMVNIPRTELNNLYEEMRHLRNEVDRMKNRSSTRRTGQRRRRDSFGDAESDLDNQDTNEHQNEGPGEDTDPHEVPDPREEPHRNFSCSDNRHRNGRGDDRTGIQKPKKPATYSGKTGWREYLIHFEMVAEFNKWDDRTKAFELALSLRDDAQVTLSDLKPQERKNFKSIVTALTSRFEPEDQSELFRSELKSRFRKKDEPLTEFAQDIKRLVRLAYPNTDVDVRATLGRNAFEDSLGDPDMEWAVHQGKPKSIETAVKLALEFEAFRGSRKQLNPPRLNKAPMRVQTEEPILENKTNNNSQNRMRDPPRNQKLCTYCARRGHLEHECFTKKKALELQQSEVNKRSSRNQGNC